MKLTHFGIVKEGKIIMDSPEVFGHNLKVIPDDTRIQFTLQEENLAVTNDQHNFLCGIVYKAMIKAGHFDTVDDADNQFKQWYQEQYHIKEEISKDDFSRAEYAHYIDFCIYRCCREGVYIEYKPPYKETL